MVWEHWPFAWLHRIEQTKAQFRTTMVIYFIFIAIFSVFFISAIYIADNGGFQICASIIYLIAMVSMLMILMLWYRSGRRRAESEERYSQEKEE